MKKLISTVVFMLLLAVSTSAVNAFTIDEVIYNKEQVVFNPETGLWSRYTPPKKQILKVPGSDDVIEIVEEEPLADSAVILTRRATPGKGSYTVFLDDKNNPVIFPNSNFEYIQDGRLIMVDNHRLKYYEMIYNDGKFESVKLTDNQLKQLFDNAQIVKISEFKDDKYITTKKFFGIKKLLLVNDTERMFYKYSYKPAKAQQTEVKGFIISKWAGGNYIYSHYGDKEGLLEIEVNLKR